MKASISLMFTKAWLKMAETDPCYNSNQTKSNKTLMTFITFHVG